MNAHRSAVALLEAEAEVETESETSCYGHGTS